MALKNTFNYQNTLYPFWTYGNKKNTPILLITGFTGVHSDVTEVSESLSKNYFVIVPDLPGWGKAIKGKSHLTINSYAYFLDSLIKSLKLSKKLNVIGHCMGAVVALEFVHLFSENIQQIFVISVPFSSGDFGQEMLLHLAEIADSSPKKLRPFLYFWRSRFIAIPLGFFVIQTRSLRKKLNIIIHNAKKQSNQDETTVEKNWTSLIEYNYQKLKDLNIPVHIIHGGKDFLVKPRQAEKLQAILKNSTLDILENSGHMPPVETPESLVTVIKKYLN